LPKYAKKVQVLVTEPQYRELEEMAARGHKKLGTLVREAVVEYHLKKTSAAKSPRRWIGFFPSQMWKPLKITRSGKRNTSGKNILAHDRFHFTILGHQSDYVCFRRPPSPSKSL
jgi:hypothetical protein